jgi:hydrogenase maturation factor
MPIRISTKGGFPMDVGQIAGMAVMMTETRNREGLSLMMVKQQADSQKQLANMIDEMARQPQSDPSFRLSVIA